MGEKKTAQGILVRTVQFELAQGFEPHWNPDRPVCSQIVNAVSMMLPHMEPFIIQSIRAVMKQITDPLLLQEAAAWMHQESEHFQQHRRFNRVLIAHGYEQLQEHERRIERDYNELRARPIKFQVAYTAGFETLALIIGHLTLAQRQYFFERADPNVASLWIWHAVEEIEHKHVAFDVYQHVYGGYWYRVYGLIFALLHLLRMVRPIYITLLRVDRRWGKLQTRWEIKKFALRFYAYVLPRLARYALPWHDPARVHDPKWMQEWVTLYDKGEGGLVRLDTARIRLSPAEMLPR